MQKTYKNIAIGGMPLASLQMAVSQNIQHKLMMSNLVILQRTTIIFISLHNEKNGLNLSLYSHMSYAPQSRSGTPGPRLLNPLRILLGRKDLLHHTHKLIFENSLHWSPDRGLLLLRSRVV